MAQLMPLPLTVSCFSKIQTGFTFLVPARRVVAERGPGRRVCYYYLKVLRCVCVIDLSLLVHLDDNFIRHFANESTFIIDIAAAPRSTSAAATDDNNNDDDDDDDDGGGGGFDVTLTEIDVYSSTAETHS